MCNIVPNLRISGGAADQHADSCAGDDSPEVLRRSVSDMLSDDVILSSFGDVDSSADVS